VDTPTAQTVQTYAQAVQAIAGTLLFFATVVTLWYLRRYTKETARLREEAHEQNEKTARLAEAAERQAQQSFMPILTLTMRQSPVPGNPAGFLYHLVVKNVGSAPAFNAFTKASSSMKLPLRLLHPRTVAVGDSEPVMFQVVGADEHPAVAWIRDVERILRNIVRDNIIMAEINFEGADGRAYETHHSLTIGPEGALLIHLDTFQHAAK